MSETREELVSVAASHGWSLDGLDVLELSADVPEENTRAPGACYKAPP